MPDLLFLAHRIPYPPNKGDKIRSWHMLEHLAKRYAVHLGCFVDDPEDWQYVPVLQSICAGSHFAPLDPRRAKLRSLTALATGVPLTFTYYRNRRLAAWVDQVHRTRPVAVQFVFCTALAPYAERAAGAAGFTGRRVVDFVDVDSDKWRQYSGSKPQPLRWLYEREAHTLAAAETAIARRADAALFVSPAEAELFRTRSGVLAEKVHAVGNGVDLAYFTPDADYPDPYPPGGPVAVFTGMMDYWANVDAVIWFAAEILPALRNQIPGLRFYIVGARPTRAVLDLAGSPGVAVTGRVPDIRPYLAHAALAVAPLRIARGIQNKVLEAMAMGKPVVATSQAFEGIDAVPGLDLLVADDAAGMLRATLALLRDEATRRHVGARARGCIVQKFAWRRQLGLLDHILQHGAPRGDPSGTADGRAAASPALAPGRETADAGQGIAQDVEGPEHA